MQDVQNIPNPGVTSTDQNDEFGSHSAIEQDLDETKDVEGPSVIDAETTESDDDSRLEQPPNIEGN